MTRDPEALAYVGITDCGCVVAAAVDEPRFARDNARTVAGWIRDGLHVERWPIERARRERLGCQHAAGAQVSGQEALAL